MAKVRCIECGALILPSTAETTGGICMACKQGIRKSMDKSREYYRLLKEYDPIRELWVSLVKRSSQDPELRGWSKPEITYFSICLLEGEIYNGGFDQYFSNSSGDYYHLALEGLEELQAHRALAILRDAAIAIFGELDPPRTQSERWALIRQSPETSLHPDREAVRYRKLEELDREFSDASEELMDSLAQYAETHGLIAPFEQEA